MSGGGAPGLLRRTLLAALAVAVFGTGLAGAYAASGADTKPRKIFQIHPSFSWAVVETAPGSKRYAVPALKVKQVPPGAVFKIAGLGQRWSFRRTSPTVGTVTFSRPWHDRTITVSVTRHATSTVAWLGYRITLRQTSKSPLIHASDRHCILLSGKLGSWPCQLKAPPAGPAPPPPSSTPPNSPPPTGTTAGGSTGGSTGGTTTGKTHVIGDINGDGTVDCADLAILKANYGQHTTVGDLNGDNVVDSSDLSILLSNWTTGSSESCADTTPPTQPAGLRILSQPPTSVAVAWSASMDDTGVSGYVVFVDNAQVGTTQNTSWTFSPLPCGTSHVFSIQAYDAAGNPSLNSDITASTGPCSLVCPTISAGSASNITSTSVDITYPWNPGNGFHPELVMNLYGYNGNPVTVSPGSSTVTFTGLTPNTSYTTLILADSDGCSVTQAPSIQFTTLP